MNIENIDLVYIVSQNLKDSIGENVANIFLNDEIVNSANITNTNSDKETACTIGAGGNHAGTVYDR